MQDIVSINRQFLIMAREAAKLPSGEIITGLSRKTLDRLTELDLEQIEKVAQGVRASLISLRLSEADIDRLISMPEDRRPSYLLSVMAAA